jgi:hypothetical protein
MSRPESDAKNKPAKRKKKVTTRGAKATNAARAAEAEKALGQGNVPGKKTTKAAVLARNGAAESADVQEDMWALVYDTKKDSWDNSKGLRKDRVPKAELDERKYPLDAAQVILKVLYTGVCGSDAGIWFRTSFKDMIFKSLAAEGKSTRIVGHEILGTVVEAGSVARARYGVEEGDIVSTESHIICGLCHQCLIGQTHVCVNEKILGISTDGGFAE